MNQQHVNEVDILWNIPCNICTVQGVPELAIYFYDIGRILLKPT